MIRNKQIKPLLPTLREKKRYLVYEVIGKQVSASDAYKAIRKATTEFLGTIGAAGLGLIPINKYQNNKGTIRLNHQYVNHVRAALLFITSINNHPVTVRSIGASGILKKAEKKYLEA